MLIRKFFIILASVLVSLIFCEGILRVKNYFILDYDVEMWRYAKLLKIKNTNPKINHTHKINSKAILQGVEIKINNFGQRDIDYNNNFLKEFDRSFLFLGSSVTLGWGVNQEDTYVNLLNNISKNDLKNWIFINGGIGNYNTERYANNYLENWSHLQFTDVVVNFFVNDTEIINQQDTNFFFKNFHLGIVLWKILNNFKSINNNQTIIQYYKEKYLEEFSGYKIAINEILKLKSFYEENNINFHIILIPDIHKINPYPLGFVDKQISKFAKQNNIKYLDIYPSIANVENKILWNKYNDPHPNELAHKLFADFIYKNLEK